MTTSWSAIGQAEQDTLPQTENLKIVNSDSWEFRGDLDPIEQHYNGNVKMTHDSVFLFCDSAIVTELKMVSRGDVIIIQSDTIQVFADSMIYNTITSEARLFMDVVLQNGAQQLFTDSLDYNLNTKIAIFPDTAILNNSRTKMSSLRGSYDVNQEKATFAGNVIVVDEEFDLTSDSLIYNTGEDKAIFVSPTNIDLGEEKIFCSSGFYDMKNGLADFGSRPIYTKGETTATADRMKYNERTSLITLLGNAEYIDGLKKATATNIIYNQKTKDIILEGDAYINDDGSIVTGDYIKYNEDTEEMEIDGEAEIDSEETFVSSQGVSKDLDSGQIIFTGEAIFQNKEDSTMVFAHELRVHNEDSHYVAVGDSVRPHMIRRMEQDSLLLSADTLVIEQRIDSLDTIKIFRAYKDVRILSENFQARSDSLYYDSKDSIFILFNDPIMWSDSTQFTGDTIKLYMLDGGIRQIRLILNSFIIEWKQADYYNQIKSKYLVAELDSGEIKKMHMDQNAESNYYILDEENAFVGLNHTLCKSMDFFFVDSELEHIYFYYEPTSLMTPIQDVSATHRFLDDFDWQEENKPKTLGDLIRVEKKAEVILQADSEMDSLLIKEIPSDSLDLNLDKNLIKGENDSNKINEKKSDPQSKN